MKPNVRPSSAIRVFGERNSGTRYLNQLLSLNIPDVVVNQHDIPGPFKRVALWLDRLDGGALGLGDVVNSVGFRLSEPRTLGWKHQLVPSPAEVVAKPRWRRKLIVTITKNPYAWLVSMYARPYERVGTTPSFEEFLSQPWRTVKRERAPAVYRHPMAMWNDKNAAYLALGGALDVINLTYEQLITDPTAAVERIRKRSGSTSLGSEVRNVDSSTKRDPRTFEHFRRYYGEDRWRDAWRQRTISLANHGLDHALMRRLGYRVLDPAELPDTPVSSPR